MHKFILFIFILSAQTLLAQTDAYELLKSQYDNYRKENKQDSALLIARKMNHLALSNEGDTSLKYAVSFRLIGNCFSSMKKNDSAIVF